MGWVGSIEVEKFAHLFGCWAGKLLFSCSGLPSCIANPRKGLWNLVVVNFEKKSSTWKGRYMSFGLTFIFLFVL